MNNQQALQMIKATLDEAIKAGVLKNIEQAYAVIQAYGTIEKALKNDSAAN